MYKLCILATVLCAVRAGLIGSPYGGLGHGLALASPYSVAGPVAVAAPAVAVAHGATSYQNSNLLALHPTAVVTKVAAPVVTAPVAVAAPLGLGLGLGPYGPLGLGLGKGLALGGYH